MFSKIYKNRNHGILEDFNAIKHVPFQDKQSIQSNNHIDTIQGNG